MNQTKEPAVLDIAGLQIDLPIGADRPHAVANLDLRIRRGEMVCLVGESGSGKSLTAMATMGLLPRVLQRGVRGTISLAGRDLLNITPQERRQIVGRDVSMIFQEPMTALHPVVNVGAQIEEVLKIHRPQLGAGERREQVLAALQAVQLPSPEQISRAYPHELSGGQRQRVMIAMALILDPMLLIADEPTTALDVTTQAEILRLIKDLQVRRGTGVLFITHDIGVVRDIADHVVVMQHGQVVEQGSAEAVLGNPQQDYTRALINAIPELGSVRAEPKELGPVLVRMTDLRKSFSRRKGLFRQERFDAVGGVDLTLRRGEVLSVVGESGSGKSTLARCLAGLTAPSDGQIVVGGDAPQGAGSRRHGQRVQMVFQDPNRSLNPRRKVGESIIEGPMNFGTSRKEAMARAAELMELVGLRPDSLDRFPYQFSGGQRQRICIARALALQPEVLIADEAVSALDATVQQQVVRLLDDIRRRLDLSILFITHDLRVAAQISDTIVVMQRGRIAEAGSVAAVLGSPQSDYTKRLLAAVPGQKHSFTEIEAND
ncbi:dipeptide ABC transporter ATP-binding protein [Devosia ginsengisoli]|uniref:ABC transporter ATP-binding protein n=1 Tax=Devosia ginsengisoli TaxID=400770 RepID=A0A5B8LQZ6_9HYPH|nr:ABC transporter ATP-binding protein [Devosia ginsengisoli]QDZ10573.1 ABC transporter ATP-binding protein [Devosia ginsengisoli]